MITYQLFVLQHVFNIHIFFFFNVSGRIDASEIQQSLAELGIDISRENALKILQRF